MIPRSLISENKFPSENNGSGNNKENKLLVVATEGEREKS
jgi:hypothetical protein